MSLKLIKQRETNGLNIDISIHTYQPQQFYPPHHDKKSRVSILLKGQLKETVGSSEELADVLSVVVKPNSIKHQNEFGPVGASMLSITWNASDPPDFFQELEILSNWKWIHGAKLAASTIEFLTDLRYFHDDESVKASVIEFIANLASMSPQSPSANPPLWLAQIKERLNDEYNTPISVQQIAKEAKVHPVYLARVFKKHYGYSIKHYLHSIRLLRSVSAIASTQEGLSQIAYQNGYSDQSHLTRQFQRYLRTSPNKFRRLTNEVAFVQDI